MSDYDEMEKQQKRQASDLKKNGYREQKIECCATCAYGYRATVEDELICNKVRGSDTWVTYDIEWNGICCKYEAFGGSVKNAAVVATDGD